MDKLHGKWLNRKLKPESNTMTKKQDLIWLRPDYKKKLKRVAKKEGVSKGTIVERGLDKIKEPKE